MKNRRRLLILAVVASALALIFSLPTLLSHPLVLPRVVALITSDLPGQLTVQSCSLTWRQGLACEGIRYQSSDAVFRLNLPRARSDKGLLTLLLAPDYLGELTVEQPVLTLLPPDAQGAASTNNTTPGPATTRQAPVSWWERWSLRLALRDGRIVSEQAAGGEPQRLAEAVALTGELAQGTLNYQLALHGAAMAGQFQAQGFINLPTADQPLLSSLISKTSVAIQDLQLEPLLELIAGRLPKVPRGQGILNASCRLRMTGTEQIEVEGESSLRQVELRGGVLAADQPRFEQLHLRFAGSRHPQQGWRLTSLDLQSAPLHFAARGFIDQRQVDFTAQGETDLALLSAQLPHLLALHQQTTIHQGHLTLDMKATGPLEGLQLQADCHTDRVQLSQSGRAYTWEKPLQVHVEASGGEQGVQLRNLRAEAPFLQAIGARNDTGFTLRVDAELDRLFAELHKIFNLDLHARGQLHGDLVARGGSGPSRVESTLQVDGLQLSRGRETILPRHELKLSTAWTGRPWPLHDLHALQVQFAGWPGELEIEAQDMAGIADLAAPSSPNCRITGRLVLERLHRLKRLLLGRQSGLVASGELRVAASGEWRGPQLAITSMQGEIDDFTFFDGIIPLLRDKQLRLGLEHRPLVLDAVHLGELIVVDGQQELPQAEPALCRIELSPLRLELHHLLVRGEALMIDLGGVLTGKPGGGEGGSRLDVLALGRLERLALWCRKQGWLGPKVDLTGQGRAQLSLRAAGPGQGEDVQLHLHAKNVALRQGKTRLLADPQVELEAQWRAEPGGRDILVVPQCSLRTSEFFVSGSAQVHRGVLPNLLELQGQVQPATALLSPFVGDLLPDMAVSLHGTQPASMLLSAPLRLPVQIQDLTLTAQVPLTELRLAGISLRDLTLPLDLNRGTLRLPVQGSVEGGAINLRPQWQWQERGPLLTLAAENEAFARIPLGRGLNALLARVSPLGSLVRTSGTLDLSLDRLTLPLHGKQQADGSLRLGLAQATPKAMPVLREVLDTAGLAEAELRFKERELHCESLESGIRCAPLRLLAGNAEISVSGQQHPNGNLAYQVELPVGEALAREAGLVVHGPFLATAAISGTRAEPLFDRQAFLASLPAQLTASLPSPAEAPEVPEAPEAPVAKAEGEAAPPPTAPPAPAEPL